MHWTLWYILSCNVLNSLGNEIVVIVKTHYQGQHKWHQQKESNNPDNYCINKNIRNIIVQHEPEINTISTYVYILCAQT